MSAHTCQGRFGAAIKTCKPSLPTLSGVQSIPGGKLDNRFTVVHAPHPFALGPDIYQDRRKHSRIYTYSYKLAVFQYRMMQWNEHACFRTGSQRMRDPCKPARHAAWFLPEELHMQATKLRCGPSDLHCSSQLQPARVPAVCLPPDSGACAAVTILTLPSGGLLWAPV